MVRGGRDSVEKLRRHAQRTARAWSLDGRPLLGISVFAVAGIGLEDLLARRFASFRTIYLPTAGAGGRGVCAAGHWSAAALHSPAAPCRRPGASRTAGRAGGCAA